MIDVSDTSHPELDLTISRVIKAPRQLVWKAWTDPASFEQWWIAAPARCQVMQMDLRPGGAFITRMSEGGADFTPHLMHKNSADRDMHAEMGFHDGWGTVADQLAALVERMS